MSHRREVDPQPAKVSLVGWGPLAPEGASRRDDEHTHFWTLAHSRVHIQMPDGRVHEEGPYLENGVTRFRPLIIRCGRSRRKRALARATPSRRKSRGLSSKRRPRRARPVVGSSPAL